MVISRYYLVFISVILFYAVPTATADIRTYMDRYFTGMALQYGFGSGTSSNNPRVEAVTHYCASGYYYSIGRSCRPNIIAKGYQCSPYEDAGRWQLSYQGNQAILQWTSNSYGPGSFAIYTRNDGVVVDPRGNAFTYVSQANCQ
jgi:hypothetical protein